MDLSKYLELINNCDENAPLLSATPLGKYLHHIPLDSLRPSDLAQLYQSLNVEQLVGTKDGLARDYRGLAELMGYNSVELEARFKRSYNPTKCLVDAFKIKDQCNPVSVTDLLILVEKLERFDTLDDILPSLIKIANESQRACQQVTKHRLNPDFVVQRQPVINGDYGRQQAHPREGGEMRHHIYDAFLCYAPEDVDYAQDVMMALENNDKRIVTVDNLLAGQFEYNALVQMIAVDCRKVIIILTPHFLESRDCEFQAKFANEIAIKSGWFPKIIPILYEPFDDAKLPPLIRVMSKIDMTRANQRDWQLKKLLGSLDYDGQLMQPATSKQYMGSRWLSVKQPDAYGSNAAANHERPSSQPSSSASNDSQSYHTSNTNDHLCVPGPLVDLAYSQSSSANISCDLSIKSELSFDTQSSIGDSSRMLVTGRDGLWANLCRSFKRKVRGSSSSRNILLPAASSNSTPDPVETDEYAS